MCDAGVPENGIGRMGRAGREVGPGGRAVGKLKSEFRARFEAKGRYREYLAAIPTYLITAQLPAFRGLKHLLGYR